MKKPIFSEEQRRSWPYPDIEVSTLKLKREFEKTYLGVLVRKTVEWLSKIISK